MVAEHWSTYLGSRYQTLRISNLVEDLRKVKEFIKSVDAQSSTISQ